MGVSFTDTRQERARADALNARDKRERDDSNEGV
jgi:hypothetical protein